MIVSVDSVAYAIQAWRGAVAGWARWGPIGVCLSSGALMCHNSCGAQPAFRRDARRNKGGGRMASKVLETVRFKKVADVMHKNVATIDGRRDRSQRNCDDATEEGLQPGGQSKDARRCMGDRDLKDIVSKIVDPGKDPKTVKVHEIMTKPVIVVSPGLASKYCARLLTTWASGGHLRLMARRSSGSSATPTSSTPSKHR